MHATRMAGTLVAALAFVSTAAFAQAPAQTPPPDSLDAQAEADAPAMAAAKAEAAAQYKWQVRCPGYVGIATENKSINTGEKGWTPLWGGSASYSVWLHESTLDKDEKGRLRLTCSYKDTPHRIRRVLGPASKCGPVGKPWPENKCDKGNSRPINYCWVGCNT